MKIKSLLFMALSLSTLAARADDVPESLKKRDSLKSKIKIDNFGVFDILKYGTQIYAKSGDFEEFKLQNFHVIPAEYSGRDKRALGAKLEIVDRVLVVPLEVDLRYVYKNLDFKGDWIREKTGFDPAFKIKLTNGTLTYRGNLLITLKSGYIDSIEVLDSPKDSQKVEKVGRVGGLIVDPNEKEMLDAVRLALETKFVTDLKVGQEVVDRSMERIAMIEAINAGILNDTAAGRAALLQGPAIPAAK